MFEIWHNPSRNLIDYVPTKDEAEKIVKKLLEGNPGAHPDDFSIYENDEPYIEEDARDSNIQSAPEEVDWPPVMYKYNDPDASWNLPK